ncbi:hypothetical protein [Parasitella parasitica]|uniref:Uncharacterized protein n=1 Tax=Parasitella parasitica TaxID=35722 RepID=A0A0B7NJF6_9FUNG|nr:hypothetical protein [Parasitella parasitica]
MLKQAINTAISIERIRKTTGKGNGTSKTTPAAPQFNTAWNPNAEHDPMEDVQVNAQQANFQKGSKKKKKTYAKKNSSAACKVCGKTNQTTENCFKLNAAVQAYKDKNVASKYGNTQSVALVQGSTKTSIHNDEFDPTKNIFYQLHSNAQASVNDSNIPMVVGSDLSNPPTSFVVLIAIPSSTQETLTSEALIDTGSMISTISQTEAKRLMLYLLPAPHHYASPMATKPKAFLINLSVFRARFNHTFLQASVCVYSGNRTSPYYSAWTGC